MSDDQSISLAIRARRLAHLARARSDDQKESQNQGQVETALRKLNTELDALERVLAVHSKLRGVGVPVDRVPGLVTPAQRLKDQVQAVSRPTAQFLHARIKDVESTRKSTSDADSRTWQAWSSQRIEALPLALMPRLGANRPAIERDLGVLRRLSLAKALRRPDITDFTTRLGFVEEALQQVDASDIDAVLARFVDRRIRLADLTDDELAMLRADGSLAEQLYVQLT